jgi:hypothetical protein
MFGVQGIGSCLFEIGGTHIVLKLWDGVSTSPINALYAGYGIGGLLMVQLAKPFIIFNELEDSMLSNNTNSTTISTQIQTPYKMYLIFSRLYSII